MAARPTRLIATLGWVLALVVLSGAARPAPAQSAQPASRIVSLVPTVTEILFAVGAGPQVVAVSSFDKFPPAVEKLTRVGALLNPDTERILSLRPNLVIVYGSQAELVAQFKQAGIPIFVYRHGGLSDTLDSITAVGAATGHAAGAATVIAGLRARLDVLRRRVAGRPRPRTLLVISREPGTLRGLYASGGLGFLHDLLELAGGSNVFADVREESVQPSQETLLTRRPDVVVELHPRPEMANAAEARRVWSPLVSVPAVRANRVHPLGGAYLVTAGPRLADAAETIGRAVHPDAFKWKILLSWSSGKDSAWALHVLRQQHPGSVAGLLTTINEAVQRVAMHAVRLDVLEAQARAAGLPLRIVPIPDPCSNDEYEARMRVCVAEAVAEGFTHMAFGDLFLEDVRRYRETHLENTGLTPMFPLWQVPTPQLAAAMMAGGLRARIACVDTRILDPAFAGREFDASLLAALPAGVDPCGENGEFHTCVYDGPMFTAPVPIETGETVTREPFVWRDLVLAPVGAGA